MKRTRATGYGEVSCATEQYNMVTGSNSIIPTYDLSKNETSITLYFNNVGDLIIVGNMVGCNYIFWMSFSRTEDKKRNEEIFNHIANDEPERVSYLDRVLEHNKIPYDTLSEFYKVHLTRVYDGECLWKTPFGHDYAKIGKEQNGSVFSDDVSRFLKEVAEWCEIRECGGNYEKILKEYELFLEKQEKYNSNVKKIEELLASEEYLCISPDENVRNIYKRCRKKCCDLHNR